MKLGLTIFIWIVVIYLILISLAYVVAIVGTVVLAVKDKKRLKEFREKRNREWLENEREIENRMTKRREEFYKRNRHITQDFDKHFKE
ncbi:putative Holliday junction resolvase-like endonuclease [Staphylococcus hominis]